MTVKCRGIWKETSQEREDTCGPQLLSCGPQLGPRLVRSWPQEAKDSAEAALFFGYSKS